MTIDNQKNLLVSLPKQTTQKIKHDGAVKVLCEDLKAQPTAISNRGNQIATKALSRNGEREYNSDGHFRVDKQARRLEWGFDSENLQRLPQ